MPVVQLYMANAEDRSALAGEARAVGGEVVVVLTPRLLVLRFPYWAPPLDAGRYVGRALSPELERWHVDEAELPELERHRLNTWRRRRERDAAVDAVTHAHLRIEAPGPTPQEPGEESSGAMYSGLPRICSVRVHAERLRGFFESFFEAIDEPTAAVRTPTLTGSIAFHLLYIEHDAAAPEYELDEPDFVDAVTWFTEEAPTNSLVVVADEQVTRVKVEHPISPGEAKLDPFEFDRSLVAAALDELGLADLHQLAQDAADRHGTGLGVAVVFCNLFADGYGYEWGGAAYLNPWGLGSKLARVTAHEVAHIFGALDEYGDCNCSAANSNCAACGPPRQLCLMDVDYAWALCDATRRSLGWQ